MLTFPISTRVSVDWALSPLPAPFFNFVAASVEKSASENTVWTFAVRPGCPSVRDWFRISPPACYAWNLEEWNLALSAVVSSAIPRLCGAYYNSFLLMACHFTDFFACSRHHIISANQTTLRVVHMRVETEIKFEVHV